MCQKKKTPYGSTPLQYFCLVWYQQLKQVVMNEDKCVVCNKAFHPNEQALCRGSAKYHRECGDRLHSCPSCNHTTLIKPKDATASKYFCANPGCEYVKRRQLCGHCQCHFDEGVIHDSEIYCDTCYHASKGQYMCWDCHQWKGMKGPGQCSDCREKFHRDIRNNHLYSNSYDYGF